MSSEISNFIKANLGRTSSKLSSSFRVYLNKKGLNADNPVNYEQEYSNWLQTIRQFPPKEKFPAIFKFEGKEITIPELYNIISRQQDKIAALEKEIAILKKHNNKYTAPPQKVLEALAIYGD